MSSSNPETVVDGKGIANDLITIGKPNSLMDMYSTTGYGDLSIAHLVIWTYELTKFDVEIAFLSALTKTKNSLRCCQAMKGELACYINRDYSMENARVRFYSRVE